MISTIFLFISDEWLKNLLTNWGFSDNSTFWISILYVTVLTISFAIILHWIVRIVSLFLLRKLENIKFFKYAISNKLHIPLASLASLLFLSVIINEIFSDFTEQVTIISKLIWIFIVFYSIQLLMAIIKSFLNLLKERPAFEHKPFKSYKQVISIILYIIGAVAVYSIISGKSPIVFFTAMGAASALLMLMFQNTIMGFVASIQVSSNSMVEIGDRVVMKKYGANGHVIEINLTTVKVKNLDETITTIPTQTLISDSFENWRSMLDGGGWRFTRSIDIKQSTIKWLSDSELKDFKKINGLKEYIEEQTAINNEFNKRVGGNEISPLNRLGITNICLFTTYIQWFLRNHPKIHQERTILARQLAPSEFGSTVEVYAFAKTSNWIEYEAIHGEVFSHVILSTEYFGLEIHEPFAMSDTVYLKMNQ